MNVHGEDTTISAVELDNSRFSGGAIGALGALVGTLNTLHEAATAAGDEADPEATEQDKVGSRLTQWATNDDQVFYPVGKTSTILQPGAYNILSHRDQILFRMFDINITGLMRLPDTKTDLILQEIEQFWTRRDLYEKYRITQRRGVMILGPTGCGKTSASKLVCVDVVKRGGVVFPFPGPEIMISGLALFRSIQPDTPVVILMEDIDEMVREGGGSTFLNMLDGVYSQFNRVVFMATSNYAERLERRLTNRPSRFDCVITMENPTVEARRLYLSTLAIDQADFDVERAVADTEGLNFAHLQELFTSTVILGVPYDKVVEKIRKMADEDLPTGDEMEYADRKGHFGLHPGKARKMMRSALTLRPSSAPDREEVPQPYAGSDGAGRGTGSTGPHQDPLQPGKAGHRLRPV